MPFIVWLKDFLGPVLSEVFRGLERVLPVALLYALVYPYARTRVLLDPRPLPSRWPDCLGRGASAAAHRRSEISHHRNRLLEILPDRLASPRWRNRCQIAGLDRLRELCAGGRPVMLAFAHFGPFTLVTFWLRALGIPATAVKLGTAETRSRTQRHKDRYKPLPMIPSVLYLDQLREVVRVISAGGVLAVAIDYPTGRQADVPLDEDRTFRMATGAVRLATRYGAELIPCNIVDEGSWRFRVELGQPVPRPHLTGEHEMAAVGKHLLAQSLPHWRDHPEQCHSELLEACQPICSPTT